MITQLSVGAFGAFQDKVLPLGAVTLSLHAKLSIVDGKGKKDRVVPVGEHACRFMQAYITLVRPWQAHDERAVFGEHHRGSRLALRTVAQIVERAVDRSGVGKRVTPHTFRHSMATHLLRDHADLRHIQAILGHKSLESTQLYTHVSLEDLKETVRRAHPHGTRAKAGVRCRDG